ncbi:MAG: flagellar biosynthesis anti-sigma factor FlgM [Planctomycetes bacterium]|nr:flagellar biosynthesis anti-sigma factor FlgM [Planctomycetota bacterium]
MVINQTSGVGAAQPVQPLRPQAVQPRASTSTAELSDKAEISLQAKLLQKLRALPDARSEKIEAVRKQIEDGTYESEEKIKAAVERILQDL